MINDLSRIKKIFAEDKNTIIEKYKGIGAGIGKRENTYVIIVYIDDADVKLLTDLNWKNIPLHMEFTGKIKLHK